jgi:hydrogenase-4 transcriptional activator
MQHFRHVLLDVWREACRHSTLEAFAQQAATLLAPHLLLQQLLICTIDTAQGRIETVAIGLPRGTHAAHTVRATADRSALRRLKTWCATSTLLTADEGARQPPPLDALAPTDLDTAVLCGPLKGTQGHLGALVLNASSGARFAARQRALVRVLLEPFAVALDNDLRVHELTVLRKAAEAENRSLLTRLGRMALGDTIVGADSGLRAVIERVTLVARSDVPVLILGETGAGKELVARAIHARSPRANGPFMRVNCGAIPPELIDSHLFGHEKGAFTGATSTRPGWFERADGGTLLLDEIGELSPPAQVRLLRILQDGWFERVGGHDPIHVDVRMVAATHRDLAAMVSAGAFREDLWYRIAVFPVRVPPLRERREDIPALARHFAARAATRFGLRPVEPCQSEIRALTSYDWPGNVREFATVVDRAAILGGGERFAIAEALGLAAPVTPPADSPPAGAPPAAQSLNPIEPLDTAMRIHIEHALQLTWGRIDGPHGAALQLRINPHTLRARMRKLGIDWRRFRQPRGNP